MFENTSSSDYLIVGAGIAGTTLALELAGRGKSVTVIDNVNPQSSSRVAAGLLSPMVPRNVRKTWKSEAIFPWVYSYYGEFEKRWDSDFIQRIPMLQIHKNLRQVHNWTIRAGQPGFESYLNIHAPQLPDYMQPLNFDCIEVLQTGRLEVKKFLEIASLHFPDEGINYHIDEFDYSQLTYENGAWNYQQGSYGAVVFCEGIGVLQNPYFNTLPYKPSGGDILELEINDLPQTHILKKKEWLLPIGNNRWIAGSTYHTNNTCLEINPEDAQQLIAEFESWVGKPIILKNHQKGIRPTVAERRPYLGEHPEFLGLYIYNGLGSKGSSLCSVLSPMYAEHLCHQSELWPELDIQQQFTPAFEPKTP